MTVGEFIRARRNHLKIPAIAVATYLRVDESFLLMVERGEKQLSPKHWEEISKFLHCDMDIIAELDKEYRAQIARRRVRP